MNHDKISSKKVRQKKFPAARLHLRDLIDSVRPMLRERNEENQIIYDPMVDILKDLPGREGQPIDESVLKGVYSGNSPNFIKPIARNIGRLLDKRDGGRIEHQELLGKITAEVDPDYCPKLTGAYIAWRVANAKRVYIFNTYLPRLAGYLKLLRNVEDLKIIVIAADSPLIADRAREMDDETQQFHNEVTKNLSDLLKEDISSEFIKEFPGTPRTPLYIFDDDIFCGFFLTDVYAIDSPQRKFKANTEEGITLLQEFDNLWGRSSNTIDNYFMPPVIYPNMQILNNLFPSLRRSLSPKTIRHVGEEMEGIYKFARFRGSYDPSKENQNPIVSGLLQIFPFERHSGAIRFLAKLPSKQAVEFDDLPTVEGCIIPYEKYVFMIGESKGAEIENQNPIFVGLQRFVRTPSNYQYIRPIGLLLRQHPSGEVLSGRVMFKCLGGKDIFAAYKKHFNKNTYMSEAEFEEEFDEKTNRLKTHPMHQQFHGLLKLDDKVESVARSKKSK